MIAKGTTPARMGARADAADRGTSGETTLRRIIGKAVGPPRKIDLPS
jgi:hypothetical protein